MSGTLPMKKMNALWKTSSGVRYFSAKPATCAVDHAFENKDQLKEPRSYKDIPGPKALPLIGNTFRFLPFIGEYANLPVPTVLSNIRETYGNMARVDSVMNRRGVIFLFDPDLCEKMYRVQGTWPLRISMESFHYYRIKRKDLYDGKLGLSTSQGKEWHDFRMQVNPHMMQPRAVIPHFPQIDEVAADFVAKIRRLRDTDTLELPPSFNNELYKWALESICSIALDHRMGCLRDDLAEDSEPQTMINCAHEMFDLMYGLEFTFSLWKVYETPKLKRLFHVLDTMNRISKKYIDQAVEKLKDKPLGDKEDRSVLQKLLSIDRQTANIMASDMLLAGVDTTGTAIGLVMYHLAKNSRVQEKLREEVMSILPEKTSNVTPETLNNVPYLKACVKEALRVSPITIGSLRTMPNDAVIGGYLIPKGMDVIACHAILSKDPANFPQPEEFIPERWLREGSGGYPQAKDAHPFAYMPFGFGARTCIGRRFAELEVEILTLKLIRNFKLEWNREPIEYKSYFINTIASPLTFKLIDL